VTAGDREELVRQIQARLIEHGFDPGPADGVDGPQTREAIRAFQVKMGIEATGEVDRGLLDLFNTDRA
jgi:peptidoglycan hydrolase-like protein with peptidoglycan-binding domain